MTFSSKIRATNQNPASTDEKTVFGRSEERKHTRYVRAHRSDNKNRFIAVGRGFGQSGAMFGLDARIALGIFGVLSLVAGAAMVLSIDSTRAKSLASELSETGRAIEAIHSDLRTDIFQSLTSPSGKNAFAALFDNHLITEDDNLRGRWLGPYIKFTSTNHPRFGEMVIQKRANNHTQACSTEAGCSLWLVYSSVKAGIVEEVDTIIDGGKEEQPNTQGRVQWTADNEGHILYYKVATALTYDTD